MCKKLISSLILITISSILLLGCSSDDKSLDLRVKRIGIIYDIKAKSAHDGVATALSVFRNSSWHNIFEKFSYNAYTSVILAESLMSREKVSIIVGSPDKELANAEGEVIKDEYVIFISPVSIGIIGDNKYITTFKDPEHGIAASQYIASYFPKATVGVLFDEFNYSREIKEAFIEECSSNGRMPVLIERLPESQAKIDGLIDGILNKKVNILYVLSDEKKIGILQQRLNNRKINDLMIISSDYQNEGINADGIYYTTVFALDYPNKGFQDWVNIYRGLHQRDPDKISMLYYDATVAALELSKRSSERVADLVIPGAAGSFSFNNGYAQKPIFFVKRVKDKEKYITSMLIEKIRHDKN